MDRRGFLRSIGLGIGGIALEQAIPLGRVWSFPKEIVVSPQFEFLSLAHWGRSFLLPNDKVRLYGGAPGGGKLAVIRAIDYHSKTITLDYPA